MKPNQCCNWISWFSYKENSLLYTIAAAKLLLHFFVSLNDNFFRDEYYYLANGAHLDWGYVDHPPLVGVIAAITTFLLGDSLFEVRLPVVLCGALAVYLSGIITKELGGNQYAQILAAICTFIAPVYLAFHGFYSMNAFDLFFWQAAILCFILIIKNPSPKLWIAFGIILGFGLQNKLSMLFFGFGLFTGMLITSPKRWLFNPYTWISAVIAFVIFLPNIIWQVMNDYPTLEFMYNASNYKNFNLSPSAFISECILEIHPFSLPIWLSGLYWLFLSKQGREFSILGWIFITCLVVFNLTNGKPYYMAVVFACVLPAGAVCISNWITALSWKWMQPVVIVFLLIGGCITAPIVLPIIPAETAVWYLDVMGIQPAKVEKGDTAALPQILADRYGWREMVSTVAEVYHSLPDNEKAKCAIITSNYGQAGAIDYWGDEFDLPKAICTHNSYFHWGYRDYTGEVMVAIAYEDDLKDFFDEVNYAATVIRPNSMPYENNKPIYICRNPKISLSEIWKQIKHFN